MYAVIKTGGKQYRVSEGTILKIEKLSASPGETVQFDEVLMVNDGNKTQVGDPYLSQPVRAEVLEHGRHNKIRIIKFKRRKHHMKRMGHRQHFTTVKITKI